MSYTITLTSPATVASSSTSPPTTSTQSHQTKRKESPPAHEVQSNSNSSGHGNDISTVTEEYLPHARMRMVREYLCGIPRVWRLTDSYRAPPRNLQEGLPNSSIASSEGDINSEQPSTRANAIDVTVLEFGDIPVKRQLFTLEDLDNHLNANPRPPNARAYFVPTSWLPVYGLLGSSLNIDHDFFALYSTKQPVPLEFSLPSFEKSNNHWRFRYMSMISGEKQIVERCVALWIADSQNDNWIAIVLCNDYEINERVARSLADRLQRPTAFFQWRPTLVQAFSVYILNPTYIDSDFPRRSSTIILVVLTIMLSEFLVSISTLAQNLEDAEEVILEISQAETSSNSDVKLLDQLRQTYPYALRHPSTYKLLLQQLSHITSSWHHQGSHNPQSIDVRRITKLLEDVHFLCQYASQLEGQNDGLLEKRATLMADLRQSSSEGGENEKRRSLEQSNENSPSDAAIQGHSIHQKSGMDMGSSRNSRGQRGPSDPGSPRKSALEDYANHIQTKVDQIAYVTNILLSLSLIATIYGMNLDIFVEGGLVHVKDYLVTALPFAFGIFLVTFGLPLVSRARHVRVEVV